MPNSEATRSWWGWGTTDAAVDVKGRSKLAMLLSMQMDVAALEPLTPPSLDGIELPPSRVSADAAPVSLAVDPHARASHCYGKAFRDVVRALRGDLSVAPDAVARPDDEASLVALLDWASREQVALIPYGGGSSVVGGVEARFREDVPAVVSVDLGGLAGVREIDEVSRAARIGAGTYGPAIEAALAPHGVTLRHFPQSFEFSTLGGWLATRAGGHFATLYTHIDDLVESMRVITPAGPIETRRLPGSGAGPSPDRLFLGSEGALGIITEAWMRLQHRPTFRASQSMAFDDVYAAAEGARRLAQSGLFPSNCRVLDPMEALINGVGDGATAFLLIAFESASGPRDVWLEQAIELARDAGGRPVDRDAQAASPAAALAGDGDAADKWKRMFLRGPYLRDALVQLGAITETFETAVVWRDFEAFHRAVVTATQDALQQICGGGLVSSRITHVYPDGAAPYFTVVAPARPGGQVDQWDAIKAAASDAILAAGGTITHHHAVGRDHRPHYLQQRPALFGDVLGAAKARLDPAGILNRGVIVP